MHLVNQNVGPSLILIVSRSQLKERDITINRGVTKASASLAGVKLVIERISCQKLRLLRSGALTTSGLRRSNCTKMIFNLFLRVM